MNNDLIRRSIYGFIIGDILGLPVEAKKRDYFKNFEITDMIANEIRKTTIGYWSDDTSMTLCTMESMYECGGINYRNLMDKFVLWASRGYMTVADRKFFGIGERTLKALEFYYNERDKRDGDKWITQVGELSVPKDKIKFSGNGSLMRALPFVFYLYNKKISVEEKVRIMCDMSSITHYSDDCKACCVFYMFFIYNLIETKDIKKSIELSRNDLNTYYDLGKCDGINRILNNDFWDIPILELKTSGYVIDTFETCLNLLCNTNNYEDAVLVAVNLGGDTDTIAAITGSMAAIYYGENSVPEKWIDKIEKKEMIDNIIDNYLKFLNSQ